jgi:hypothetical protein
MSFASDVTDKLQLGSQCYSNIPHKTYGQRMRLQRSQLTNSMKSAYVVNEVQITNPGINYTVGAYVQLNDVGTPPLLIQVKSLTSYYNGIQDFAIVNTPNISFEPVGDIPTTDISRVPTGSGATFLVSVTSNPKICCICPTQIYSDIDSHFTFRINSINLTKAGSGYFKGQIIELQCDDSPIVICVDQVSLSGRILEFSVLFMSTTVNQVPINPVKHLTGNAEFNVIVN